MNDHRTMGAPEASAAALGAGAAPKPSGKPQAPPSLPHAPREYAFDMGLWDEVHAALLSYCRDYTPDRVAVEILPFSDPYTDREGMKIRAWVIMAPRHLGKYAAIGNITGLRRALKGGIGALFTPEGAECLQFWDPEPEAGAVMPEFYSDPAICPSYNCPGPRGFAHSHHPTGWISTVNEEVGSVVRPSPESGPPSTASLSRTCPNCRTVTRIPTMNDRCGYCPEHPRLIGGCA